jgi:DNA primase
MLIAGPDIPEPYDRFRHRVMFPILDMKGRVIAFGGRALEKDVPAKYLNSPETPLFHKGHILFNAARARPVAHDRDRIIAVEGYMDVVALHEGGFPEAVAPLGTALTEDQLKLLWRFCDVPTLCFDGDSAGKKAAFRAVDTALPHLKPGKSVQFAFLPDGLDPDDLIRQQGAAAMTDVLERTRALIDVLWERETSITPLATPEQRAALQAKLHSLTNTIADPLVRQHYQRELRDRLYALGRPVYKPQAGASAQAGKGIRGSFYSSGGPPAPDWRQRERARLFGDRMGRLPRRPDAPLPASSELVGLSHAVSPREALIVKAILNHPWLIDDHAEALADLSFSSHALSALRDEILNVHAVQNSLDSATLRSQLSKTGVSKVVDLVERTITHRSDRFAEPEASATDVETGWRHVLALHQRQDGLERSLKAAEEAWYRDCTPEAEARLLDLKRQLAQLSSVDHVDNMDLIDPQPGGAAKQAS